MYHVSWPVAAIPLREGPVPKRSPNNSICDSEILAQASDDHMFFLLPSLSSTQIMDRVLVVMSVTRKDRAYPPHIEHLGAAPGPGPLELC